MVQTRSRYYRSPSPDYLEGAHTVDFEPAVDTDEAFEPISALDTTSRLRVLSVGTFDEMDDDPRHVVRDRFSGRAGGISLPDWKLRFRTWMKEKRQRSPSFNDWYAFELLPQHLEFEALQTYERWTDEHELQLREVERYWEARVELISALKEGAVASLLPTVKVEEKPAEGSGSSSEDTKGKALVLGQPSITLSRVAQATQAALSAIGEPPVFDPLRLFIAHLEIEYGGFRRDQMQRIQDFRREKEDTPRTMYTRLARFAVESGGVFAESQLVKIFLSKIDKRLLDLAMPRIILHYHGRATLAQAFTEVEMCDRALCQHDATDMVSWMTDASKSKKAATATSSLAETQPEKPVHCWGCGEAGHTKNDPNCPKKRRAPQPEKAKQRAEVVKTVEKAKKKQLKCSHCGKLNHDDDHCFLLHPEKRPVSEKEKALEAKLAELEKRFKTVASLGQVTNSRVFSRGGADTSTSDIYMFGASGEMMAAVATRAQAAAKVVTPAVDESTDLGRTRHSGSPDHIGQARLPLSFGLADTASAPQPHVSALARDEEPVARDSVHTLAHKVLQMPMFSSIDVLASDFKPARVFHLAGQMLEGKVAMPSLEVAQAVTEPSTDEDLAKLRAKLAAEAIATFDEGVSQPMMPHPSSTMPSAMGIAYLADVAARSARERRSLRPGVVRLVNDNNVLVVSRTGGNPTRATPLRVMMDSGAQPVMIGKRLAQDLGLTAADLEPCPFTIVTSVGGTERATGYTRQPLQLIFCIGPGPLYSHLSLQCAVTSATNYDILVGQQALYPLGFGLDNWTEEAWIRPGWSTGDGRKEFIPVAFAAAAMTMSAETLFGCSALASDLPCGTVLLEETFAFLSTSMDVSGAPPLEVPARHCKDPFPPWCTRAELSRQCRDAVTSLDPEEVSFTSSSSIFARPIHWHPPEDGITLVELFAGIGTGLAAVLEAGIKVRRYIHVDTGFVSNKAARHHLQRLLALYPEQLSSSAIHGCFGQLPRDVTLISDEDLRRLGHVDLLIAGWPCQGHSRAGAGRGLDDPRSSLFADLIRLTQWWFTHQATPPGYIFENVPPLGDSRSKVREDGQYICQVLGPPTFVDAASLGSYAHRPRWIWTNLVPSQVLATALARVQRPPGRKVDDILDDHRIALVVSKDDESPFALVNKVGAPRGALPTFMTYPGSFAFRGRGPGMVWDSLSQTHEEPNADERERAMGFLTGTTAAPDLTEGQRRFLLGQAMDLNTLVWILGMCLAVQQHHRGHLLAVRPQSNGQGAVMPNLTEVEESELLFRLKWHAAEELRAQRVFAALAQEFGKADAQEMFSRVFLHDNPFFVDTASSHSDRDSEAPHLTSSEDAGGMDVAPSTD